jgi:NTP pyrophosphatase (non-canonical NTP hydrolase)
LNINNLIAEAHANAVAHGFWEEDRPFAETVDLIHSELSEALEEFRKGKGLNEIYFSCHEPWIKKCPHFTGTCEGCFGSKPEGIPIEFADTVIRIGDYLGHEKVDAERTIDDDGIDATDKDWIPEHIRKDMKTFQGFIATGHWLLSHAYEYRIGTWSTLIFMVLVIEEFCQNNGIDLEKAIQLKMKYNKTRPYKHGKKI